MQEALDGGERDKGAGVDHGNGHADLAVPGAERQAAALEAVHLELGVQQVGAQRGGIGGIGAGDGLAQGADGKPGGIVLTAHVAMGGLFKTVLQLHRAPAFDDGGPGGRDHAVRPCHRAREPGVVLDIAAEIVGLVGDQHHVVIGKVLHEAGNFIHGRIAQVGVEGPVLLGGDGDGKLGGRPAQGVGEGTVGGVRAGDEDGRLPLLLLQDLHQRIGAGGILGEGVEKVGATVGGTEVLGAGGDVEEERALRFGQVGDGQDRGGIGVDQDQARGLQRLDRGDGQVSSCWNRDERQRVGMAHEGPGGQVVLKRKLGPGDAEVFRHGVEVRQHRGAVDLQPQVGDRDRQLGPCRDGCRKDRDGQDDAEHGALPPDQDCDRGQR